MCESPLFDKSHQFSVKIHLPPTEICLCQMLEQRQLNPKIQMRHCRNILFGVKMIPYLINKRTVEFKSSNDAFQRESLNAGLLSSINRYNDVLNVWTEIKVCPSSGSLWCMSLSIAPDIILMTRFIKWVQRRRGQGTGEAQFFLRGNTLFFCRNDPRVQPRRNAQLPDCFCSSCMVMRTLRAKRGRAHGSDFWISCC